MAFFSTTVDTLLRNDLDRTYEDMSFGDNFAALIGLFKKKDESGDAVKVPLKLSIGPGQGGTAATAYANAGLANRASFVVTPFKVYQHELVDMSQAVFTKGDDNAVVDLLLDEAKTAMDGCKKQLDQFLASDGSGTIGTISTATNTSGSSWDLVLTLASDVNNFTPNQVLVTKATAFNGSLDAGTLVVNKVTASNKTITVTSSGSTPAATHVLGVSGTMLASTSLATFAGIPAFIPPIASRPVSSTLFFGVDRSVQEQALAGTAYDGTGRDILESISVTAHSVANVPGARPDMIVMSYATLGKIQNALQTQGRYVDVQGKDIEVFYRYIEVSGPAGPMYIVPSASWRDDLVAILSSDSWTLGAPGNKPFQPITPDGSVFANIPGSDTAVGAYRGAGFVYCNAPGHNGMITITP